MLHTVAGLLHQSFIRCFLEVISKDLSYLGLIAIRRFHLAAKACNRSGKWENRMAGMLASGLVFGIGFNSTAWAQSSTRFDGQYRGELTLTKVIKENCTEPPLGALYPLNISKGEVRFVYVPRFDTTLRGRVDDNGVLTASARLKHGSARMTGRVQGNRITASIVTPSCHYTYQTKDFN